MKPDNGFTKLVVLASRFGLNFSGGSSATCEIVSRLRGEFHEVIVVAQEVGKHNVGDIKVEIFSSLLQAEKIIRKLNVGKPLFYGDFYDSIVFVNAGVPFVFSYHDNWPEQRFLNVRSQALYDYYWKIYKKIFIAARVVFSVSKYKKNIIKQYNKHTILLRNGTSLSSRKKTLESTFNKNTSLRVLMIGNIDERKYYKSIQVFNILSQQEENIYQIDIYGNTISSRIANKLNSFKFVSVKGFSDRIDFSKYDLFLCTSYIENLPISIVESLKHHLPVISFDVGGVSEVVNSKNGVLVPPFDYNYMCTQIKLVDEGIKKFSFMNQDLSSFDWDFTASHLLMSVQI